MVSMLGCCGDLGVDVCTLSGCHWNVGDFRGFGSFMDGLENQPLTAVLKRHCLQFPFGIVVPEMLRCFGQSGKVALVNANRSIYVSKDHLEDRAAITHLLQGLSKLLGTIRLFNITGRPNDRYMARTATFEQSIGSPNPNPFRAWRIVPTESTERFVQSSRQYN